MSDLKNPRLIYLKGILFLLCGIFAVALLLIHSPFWQTGALLAVAIWCFCRFYYFVFYVIQHYVDDDFRFAGLIDFAQYCVGQHVSKTEIPERTDKSG